jgi:hypothetical protein
VQGELRGYHYPTAPQILHRILTHLGLPTCAPATAPARSVDLDAPELDFEDPGDAEQQARPSPPAARSPPLPDWQVDADAPVDDDTPLLGSVSQHHCSAAGTSTLTYVPPAKPLLPQLSIAPEAAPPGQLVS